MPAQNEWIVPGRVLASHFSGDLQLDEVKASNSEAQVWIASAGIAPVHTIVDLSGVQRYPTSLKDVRSIVRVDNPDMAGWTIIVSGNTIIRFISSTVTQLLRQKVRVFDSLVDAYTFLWETDPSLPVEARPAPVSQSTPASGG
jgi:hypothetical protein